MCQGIHQLCSADDIDLEDHAEKRKEPHLLGAFNKNLAGKFQALKGL